MRATTMAIVMLLVGATAGAGIVWYGLGHPPLQFTATPAYESSPSDNPDPTDSPEAADVSAPVSPSTLSVNAAGEAVVRLDTETQQHVGLTTAVLMAATRRPDVTAYGLLQEDPSRTFMLRAPAAGTLQAADSGSWPGLHATVEENELVGILTPRLTPMEQIDLAARLTQARADASEAEAALTSARSSYQHKQELNADSKAVSDRALEEAQAAVQTQEARLQAAQRIVALVEAAQNGGVTDAAFELHIPLAGEVLAVLTQPGEAVEPGQALLRVTDFDTLIARVELPVGVAHDPSDTTAEIELVGNDSPVLPARRIGLGATLDSSAHGTTLLYRLENPERALRPGIAIIAHIPAPGGERSGVLIPRAAVIRLFGNMWVYLAEPDGTFIRRQLVDAERVNESWFAVQGFAPGDHVVTAGAQVLLSEELKAQIEREEAASE